MPYTVTYILVQAHLISFCAAARISTGYPSLLFTISSRKFFVIVINTQGAISIKNCYNIIICHFSKLQRFTEITFIFCKLSKTFRIRKCKFYFSFSVKIRFQFLHPYIKFSSIFITVTFAIFEFLLSKLSLSLC